ncbi:hypothetical protein B0G85_0475 [Polynucleobacter brandtiae]|uniref:DNA-binding protein n=1 Tax=Polynucleobacter brandtiae TaxID=1938816 RepID=A0A2M8VZ15_9BURK|nr:hypothetical protein B0G85_0475 [Polynucleobacter brandtiae]
MKNLSKDLINYSNNQELISAESRQLTTNEFANAFRITCQTVRKNHCLFGHCYGIRPIKVGNKLLWPSQNVVEMLEGVVQ